METHLNLSKNLWKNWGFKGNPFETNPLTMHSSLLPISKAFVGRSPQSSETKQLLNIIRNSQGGRGIVEGEIGVGKTTLVNYHRYLWEYEADEKLLSPFREISVYGDWEAKDILKEILGHLSHKLLFVLEKKKIKKNNLLEKTRYLYDIFYHESWGVEGNAFGFGISYTNQKQINIPDMTESQLIAYIMDMVSAIKKIGYEGVFLHFDNLELISYRDLQNCKQLFEEIRDILQLPDLYYIFVAQKGFYSQVIAPSQRVSSIMSWPVKVPVLTLDQVIEAINIRYQLLSLNPGKEIQPVTDEFIKTLYELHQGKIRFIMDSITQMMNYCLEKKPCTVKYSEAEHLFLEITKSKTTCLSTREKQVLYAALEFENFTNNDLVKKLKMKAPNVSSIFSKLAEENFIYQVKRQGRNIYYRTSKELKVLLKEKKELPFKTQSSPQKNHCKAIVKYLEKNKTITRVECEKLLETSPATAKRHLAKLISTKQIVRVGKGRSTYYTKGFCRKICPGR